MLAAVGQPACALRRQLATVRMTSAADRESRTRVAKVASRMTERTAAGDTHVVGVFQDVAWAERGVAALVADGFAPSAITVVAARSGDAERLIRESIGIEPHLIEVKSLGPCVAAGPLLSTLKGTDDGLTSTGLAAVFNRAGFQKHDGYIFEQLVRRGGVLVAVVSEPRAADALAKLHSYGAGNAAIGAWAGRV
jgi:hypothetical protein